MDKSSQKKFFFREDERRNISFSPFCEKKLGAGGAILATGKEGNWKIPLL